jgi:hypothetical protein
MLWSGSMGTVVELKCHVSRAYHMIAASLGPDYDVSLISDVIMTSLLIYDIIQNLLVAMTS